MKRTLPLLITAIVGFVLIGASFVPDTEDWGETAMIWFDILAAIAFILGGGNLLMTHLKKVSDRVAGWGYSMITLTAFLVTLLAGIFKIGSPPATETEYYGESFVKLALADIPRSQEARVPGTIPKRADGAPLPPSVRKQLRQQDGRIVFRGWMQRNQMQDLTDYQRELAWQCAVETLFDKSQPEEPLKGSVAYYADHSSLAFQGAMNNEQRQALLAMADAEGSPDWTQAVNQLYKRSRHVTQITVEPVPDHFVIPESLKDDLAYDTVSHRLTFVGPMSRAQRDALANQFPPARPMRGARRDAFIGQIEALGGKLNKEQLKALDKLLKGPWNTQELQTALNVAGQAEPQKKTACEMYEEMRAGNSVIDPQKPAGKSVSLNAAQVSLLEAFVDDPTMSVERLAELLKESGPFIDQQKSAFDVFFERTQTTGARNTNLAFALLALGPLNRSQRNFLFQDYRREVAWRTSVSRLWLNAHQVKYPWSGDYGAEGSLFWWLYEYAFKPLTATMFAMLAFYVASAAFRAFRIKNIEAFLLLGTAFIILLGRTFLGTLLTEWIPQPFAAFRIENITDTIMQVVNTAGNRAIMIGIALGIASTSLKVLLGIDRSYLGGPEE